MPRKPKPPQDEPSTRPTVSTPAKPEPTAPIDAPPIYPIRGPADWAASAETNRGDPPSPDLWKDAPVGAHSDDQGRIYDPHKKDWITLDECAVRYPKVVAAVFKARDEGSIKSVSVLGYIVWGVQDFDFLRTQLARRPLSRQGIAFQRGTVLCDWLTVTLRMWREISLTPNEMDEYSDTVDRMWFAYEGQTQGAAVRMALMKIIDEAARGLDAIAIYHDVNGWWHQLKWASFGGAQRTPSEAMDFAVRYVRDDLRRGYPAYVIQLDAIRKAIEAWRNKAPGRRSVSKYEHIRQILQSAGLTDVTPRGDTPAKIEAERKRIVETLKTAWEKQSKEG